MDSESKLEIAHKDELTTQESQGHVPAQVPALETSDLMVKTPAMRRRTWIQFGALCFAFFYCGWNDGTTGPLIPRLQEVYHVNYAVVSLIFIVNCVGYIIGASSYVYITDRFGFGLMVVAASFVYIIGVSIQASAAPFPAFVVAYLFTGIGGSYLDGGTNAYVAGFDEDTSIKMGIMHAVYGFGAFCAPLVSTQFAQLTHWSYVYFVHIGLLVVNIILQSVVFRFQSQNECLADIGQVPPEKTKASLEGVNKYKQVMRLRAVHFMSFFIFTYVGVEVTIGGWIVSYIEKQRHGGSNSGYISSGFWGGLTLGRVALLWVNSKVGHWRVIFLYVFVVLGLELVVWLVPNLYSSAVCVSFVGFFLGPIFPIVMNHAGTILPPELVGGGVGWIVSFGSAGSAVFPFIAGAISSGTSIGSLQPLLIAMMGLLIVLWACVPRTRVHSG